MTKPKRPTDVVERAVFIGKIATGEINDTPKNTKLAASGVKGRKARANKLTPKKRSDIAKKAARVRWAKK
jgi:hypothetical protein